MGRNAARIVWRNLVAPSLSMYLRDGPPSWKLTLSIPTGLTVLLYIRDAAQIGPAGALALPPLTPPVRAMTTSVDEIRLATQWTQRWTQSLGPDGLTDIGMESPESPTFDATPELRQVYEELHPRALRWARDRKAEAFPLVRQPKPRNRADSSAAIVRDWEIETGRRSAPFDLSIHVIPLDGIDPHRVSTSHYIVPLNLLRERGAYMAWLRETITHLARGRP